jgi:hypothetical protein
LWQRGGGGFQATQEPLQTALLQSITFIAGHHGSTNLLSLPPELVRTIFPNVEVEVVRSLSSTLVAPSRTTRPLASSHRAGVREALLALTVLAPTVGNLIGVPKRAVGSVLALGPTGTTPLAEPSLGRTLGGSAAIAPTGGSRTRVLARCLTITCKVPALTAVVANQVPARNGCVTVSTPVILSNLTIPVRFSHQVVRIGLVVPTLGREL